MKLKPVLEQMHWIGYHSHSFLIKEKPILNQTQSSEELNKEEESDTIQRINAKTWLVQKSPLLPFKPPQAHLANVSALASAEAEAAAPELTPVPELVKNTAKQ